MTLVRLTNPVTAAHWLTDCSNALATAVDAADLDAVVIAAGARALALHGLREIDGPAPVRRRGPVRRSTRTARFSRATVLS